MFEFICAADLHQCLLIQISLPWVGTISQHNSIGIQIESINDPKVQAQFL